MSETPSSGVPAPEVPDSPPPSWCLITPAQMARMVVSVFRANLAEYGLRPLRVELITTRTWDLAAKKLTGLPSQPADQAMETALPVVCEAFAAAMNHYSMGVWALNALEDRVRGEMDETIAEHMTLRDKQRVEEPPTEVGTNGEGPPGG